MSGSDHMQSEIFEELLANGGLEIPTLTVKNPGNSMTSFGRLKQAGFS